MPVIEFRAEVGVPAAEAFRWHARPGAFSRLSPPWDRVEILEARGGIENGGRVVMRLGRPPLSVRWTHEHVFTELPEGRSAVVDRVDYELPLGRMGEFLLGPTVRRRLERVFRYRGAVTAEDLARHAPHRGSPALRVAITGASGLIGEQLAAFLTTGGHEVLRLVRGRTAREGEIAWNPATGRIDHEALEGLDAVVHLAGASIAGGRWTEARKREILASRVAGTKLLAEAISVLRDPPAVFVCASAVGYYGDRGETRVDEDAEPGSGFLADVVRAWEGAAEPAEAVGIRTVKMRFGVVVTSRGGALAKMKPAFLLGAGGPIGTGRQGFSWIALDDAVYAVFHAIRHDGIRGAVNAVAPEPVTQRAFAQALGQALHRPAIVPLPAYVVRQLFGQLGEEALLRGQFVEPAVLGRTAFVWSLPRLSEALDR